MIDLNMLGAITALWIYFFSILVFLTRLLDNPHQERMAAIMLYFSAIPLLYLLFTAGQAGRPLLFYIQVGLMLLWLVVSYLLDMRLKVDFRKELRWVIVYVMLFFAGTGGMLGVAALAGQGWMIAALVLFFLMAALTFYQRAQTGK